MGGLGYTLFGALFAGVIGDLVGRRADMMSALVAYTVPSLVCTIVSDWQLFWILRIVVGAGLGAESSSRRSTARVLAGAVVRYPGPPVGSCPEN
jgi:MFS family permease